MPKLYLKYIQSISKGGDDMPDYQKLYALMFNAATDALAALGHMDFGQARDILREAQREAEELYLTAEEEE